VIVLGDDDLSFGIDIQPELDHRRRVTNLGSGDSE